MATDDATVFMVDAHCHVFNASDLSVVGFLNSVVVNTDERFPVFGPLIRFLGRLVRGAPTADEERRWLETRSWGLSLNTMGEAEGWDVAFALDLQAELEALGASRAPGDEELLRWLVTESSVGAVVSLDRAAVRSRVAPDVSGIGELARRLLSVPSTVHRHILWVKRLKQYRWLILLELLESFGSTRGPQGVHLFTPALVDLQHWLGNDAPGTSLPAQYELMSLISTLVPGRMHPLAAFDPWRESLAPGTLRGSLLSAQRAVRELGHIGVKLYPPMGFAPMGNADLDFDAVGQNNPAFGASLDEALRALFGWAVEEEVPIMAHASDSVENKSGYGERAGPAFWEKALDAFPKLRVNLAHIGGHRTLSDEGGWADRFAGLMGRYDHVYADFGHFDLVLESGGVERLAEELGAFLGKHPIALERLMFGTDWSMLAREANWERYLERVLACFERIVTDTGIPREKLDAILGDNAMRFYGIKPNGANATRLRAFYERENIRKPFWLQAEETA